MVSNLPIMAMKFKSFKLRDNFPKIILLLIAVLAILFLHWTAVPVIFVAYILLSLLMRNQTT
jgi:CDP-diacylglycerol--serine O-phosphatidyltransferase